MKELLTPKQVAQAIHVSESSVKRWCDKGIIPTRVTAGGHRRIPLAGLLSFVRESEHQLVRPEALGLPANSGACDLTLEDAAERMTEGLLAGDDEQCRRLTLELYLAEHRLSVLCDRVFAAAFARIGSRWACGEAEVYQERRGCEIARRMLHELRMLAAAPPLDAPLAMGGAAEGDLYNLGTTMAELVLRDSRWNAVSLGDNLPFPSLAAALRAHQPRMFWLSCSHIAEESRFLADYARLYDAFGDKTAFVVGGRGLTEPIRRQIKFAGYCENMQQLEDFAHALRASAPG